MYLNFYDRLAIKVNGKGHFMDILMKNYKHYISNTINESLNNVITLSLVNKIDEAPFYFIHKEVAYNYNGFYILDNQGKKFKFDFDKVFDNDGSEMIVEKDYNYYLFNNFIKALISIRLCNSGMVPVHSSSVVYNNTGILFPGWAGTGKTRFLLKFIDSGGEFVSDEWTFIGNGKLFTFFDDFKMMDYDIKEFSKYSKLTIIEQIRLLSNSFCKNNFIKKILNFFNIPLVYKQFDLPTFFSKISNNVKFEKVYFLQRYNGEILRKEPIGINELINKIYQSFLRENRIFFYYHDLFKFAYSQKEKHLEYVLDEKYKKYLFEYLRDKECSVLAIPLRLSMRNVDIKYIMNYPQ